jgi:hypothetical protein
VGVKVGSGLKVGVVFDALVSGREVDTLGVGTETFALHDEMSTLIRVKSSNDDLNVRIICP